MSADFERFEYHTSLDILRQLGFVFNNLKMGRNRVSTITHRQKRNGWIYINDECIAYGSWDESIERGVIPLYSPDILTTTFKERLKQQDRLRQKMREIEEIEYQNRIRDVRLDYDEMAQRTANPFHGYLVSKRAHCDIKLKQHVKQEELIIPMFKTDKQLYGYQTIDPVGNKRFGGGSILKGSFFPITKDKQLLTHSKLILLCEGYSTGSSIFQATSDILGCSTVVCFSACNVDYVHQELIKIIDCPIIAIKDNDEAGIRVMTLGFTVGEEGEDANDVHMYRGIGALRDIIRTELKRINLLKD